MKLSGPVLLIFPALCESRDLTDWIVHWHWGGKWVWFGGLHVSARLCEAVEPRHPHRDVQRNADFFVCLFIEWSWKKIPSRSTAQGDAAWIKRCFIKPAVVYRGSCCTGCCFSIEAAGLWAELRIWGQRLFPCTTNISEMLKNWRSDHATSVALVSLIQSPFFLTSFSFKCKNLFYTASKPLMWHIRILSVFDIDGLASISVRNTVLQTRLTLCGPRDNDKSLRCKCQ